MKLGRINTASNYLSISRIFLIIPIFYFISNVNVDYSYRIYSFLLILLATITDLLDGYLARKLDQVTEFGKIIDPLADKLAIGLVIIKLYLLGEIPEYYFWIIVLRDVIIFTGGIFVSKYVGKVLPSNLLGKITVVTIGFYIVAVVLQLNPATLLYDILLYVSIIMSFASVIGYGIRGYESIKWKKHGTL